MSEINTPKIKSPSIPGTKRSPKCNLLVSTGLQSLDNIIGGGLPVGSIFLIEEDKFDFYSKILLKYFMAEGIVASHPLMVASHFISEKFVKELPALSDDQDLHKTESKTDEQMKIAWRYQNQRMKNLNNKHETFCHNYDLSNTMSIDNVETFIELWQPMSHISILSTLFSNDLYCDLLFSLQDTLHQQNCYILNDVMPTTVLRIAFHSLGSRLWLAESQDKSHSDLLKLFYFVKSLMKYSFAVCVITVPVHQFKDDNFIKKLEHISDIAIRLESFADSPKETNPSFKDYHGLLHIKKLSAINSLVPECSLHKDIGFKLRRKKLVIEILHLPPDLNDTTQREQDEATTSTASVGCANTSQKLDF